VPPRYAYWTILIDDKPTAFRAREREELLPTFVQLQRKNTHVTMQWFARGLLWASREAERDDFQQRKHAAAAPRDSRADRPDGAERRGSDWRPGGTHKDPRDRFKKKNRPERGWSEKDPATQRDRDKLGPPRESRPWRDKPAGPPRGDRPWSGTPRPPSSDSNGQHHGSSDSRTSGGGWSGKPGGGGKRPWSGRPPGKPRAAAGDNRERPRERKPWNEKPAGGAPPSDRPWQTKPTGPRAQRKPWSGKPAGSGKRPWTVGKPPDKSDAPRGFRSNRPPGNAPPGDRKPWQDRSSGGAQSRRPAGPRDRKPWSDKPAGAAPRGDRPWSNRPPGGAPRSDGKTWQNKPSGGGKPFRPRTGPPQNGPRKKRDDEPPDRG
jgi:hypothetical protein